MEQLNLPEAKLKITSNKEGTWVYDILRKKNILLTAEEWVRQHFIHFAIDHLGYPKSLIKVEAGHVKNSMRRRTDLLLYNNKGVPSVLIECKKPDEKLNQKAINQAVRYNSIIMASYIVIANGIRSYCFSYNEKKSSYDSIDYFPSYQEISAGQDK